MTRRMTRGLEHLQAGVNALNVRANTTRAACRSMFFLAKEPTSKMMIAAEHSKTDMVPAPIDLMRRDAGGSSTLVSIMAWNRYMLLDTNLGRATTGTSRARNGESTPRLAYGVLTATSISTQTPMFDPEAQAYGSWPKKTPAVARRGLWNRSASRHWPTSSTALGPVRAKELSNSRLAKARSKHSKLLHSPLNSLVANQGCSCSDHQTTASRPV